MEGRYERRRVKKGAKYAKEEGQSALQEIEDDHQEFVFRHFDIKVSVRSRR